MKGCRRVAYTRTLYSGEKKKTKQKQKQKQKKTKKKKKNLHRSLYIHIVPTHDLP